MEYVDIIGGGHNGLVAAIELALAGYKVRVFEQSSFIGGAARSDNVTFAPDTASTFAYVNGLMSDELVKKYNLRQHKYATHSREPSQLKLLPDGRFLSIGTDDAENFRQISKYSVPDAYAYPIYNEKFARIGEFLESFCFQSPPPLPPKSTEDVKVWLSVLKRACALGPADMYRLLQVFMCDPHTILNKWFESDVVRSALFPDATIGSIHPSSLVLILHAFTGNAGGSRGIWAVQHGGMGGITKALAEAAKEAGVEISLNAPVKSIAINNAGRAMGVWLEDGSFCSADVVVSNATPHETFTKLVPREAVPKRYMQKILRTSYTSASTKINVILSGLPVFKALMSVKDPTYYMRGSIHIAPTMKYMDKALRQAIEDGEPSDEPMMEMTIPSVVDDSLSPIGHHVMTLFVQYTPYRPKSGPWTEERKNEYFEKNVLGVLRQYIDNIDEIVVNKQILTPPDIERMLKMTGGNIFHGDMSWRQLGPFRTPYRTPVTNLWLCGAGTHPGGGVMGACGYNAAQEIIKDLKK